jgi:hypothetical protein
VHNGQGNSDQVRSFAIGQKASVKACSELTLFSLIVALKRGWGFPILFFFVIFLDLLIEY